jgi:hypothetical protein
MYLSGESEAMRKDLLPQSTQSSTQYLKKDTVLSLSLSSLAREREKYRGPESG